MRKKNKTIDEAFVKKGMKSVSDKDFDTVFEKKDQLFEKLNHPDWKIYKDKIGLMFQMLKDVKQKRYPETPWKTLAAIVFTLLYVINPLDLMPDFIPILGYIDDITVLGLALKLINKDLAFYKEWKTAESSTVEKSKASED